jgi:hypothetical protein
MSRPKLKPRLGCDIDLSPGLPAKPLELEGVNGAFEARSHTQNEPEREKRETR